MLPAPSPTISPPAVPAAFRPRIVLQTLGRGDGLLGLRPAGPFGPRGERVTVARIDWTYTAPGGLRWETPAPVSVLYRRADAHHDVEDAAGRRLPLRRDPDAEAEAAGTLWTLGLHPLPAVALQWRSDEAAAPHAGPLWSLLREEDFGDFWADRVPELQARGWSVVVRPGFAHLSVPVEAWRLRVRPETGEELGLEPAAPWAARPRAVGPLGLPAREGAWLLTLGIEVEGESLDLAPLLADLLRRDARWRDLRRLAAIDPAEPVTLRMPGGRRVTAPAAPLQAIVGAMLDLLTDPKRADGPLRLSAWDAHRLDDVRRGLDRGAVGTAAGDASGRDAGAWRFEGDADLQALAQRLRAAGAPPPVAAPRGLGVTLRPYQQRGLAWLQYLRAHGLAGILADDMGLGKTAQALAHLLLEKESGRADRPSLAVVPTSLVFNWQAEARRMAPGLRVLVLQGAARAEDFGRMAAHDLVITTYPLVWRDIDALRAQPFHLLVLDEAQTVKNPDARSAKALRRLRARHRLCLTGTPLENHLGELWAQFDFLMPGFLGDARGFQRLWRKPIEEGGETLRADLLARRIRPFVLRRRKEQVAAELPPLTEIVERVPLRGRQRALYESVRVAADKQVRRVLQRSGFAGAQIAVLDALLKLRQVCCDPRLLRDAAPGARDAFAEGPGASGVPGDAPEGASDRAFDGAPGGPPPPMERAKIERLRVLLPALVEDGRRILVFSQFTGMLDLVGAELDALGLRWLCLTGNTLPDRRGEVVRRFQAREAPLLLASLKAGGTGLNLTAADTVVHLDPWWNPAVEAQATARAHRIGQDRPVFVYQLLVEGSIEERMRELQARKAALAEGVLGHDAPDAAKFGPGDLDLLLAPLDSA